LDHFPIEKKQEINRIPSAGEEHAESPNLGSNFIDWVKEHKQESITASSIVIPLFLSRGRNLTPLKTALEDSLETNKSQVAEIAISLGHKLKERLGSFLRVNKKLPQFDKDGFLPPGEYCLSWPEFQEAFGTTAHRKELLTRFSGAVDELRKANVKELHVGGSFVTTKPAPLDIDAGWMTYGMNTKKLRAQNSPLFHDGAEQKRRFGGELFRNDIGLDPHGTDAVPIKEFFKHSRQPNREVGVVILDLWKAF
jgi:hypothetical protein